MVAWGSEVRVKYRYKQKDKGGRRSVEDLEGVTVSVGQQKEKWKKERTDVELLSQRRGSATVW